MGNSERIQNQSGNSEILQQPFEFWPAMQKLYRLDAETIIAHIEQGEGIIVTNGHGVGKTRLLTPQLYKVARGKEMAIAMVDYYQDVHKAALGMEEELIDIVLMGFDARDIKDANPAQRKVLVIDEFQYGAAYEPEQARQLIAGIVQRNITPIFYTPAPTEEQRLQFAQFIQDTVSSTAAPYAVYRMKQISVPVNLARQELVLRGADEELINFYLNPENSALLNPGLYGETQECKTIDALKQRMRARFPGTPRSVWSEWLGYGGLGGGSKQEMVKMLINLGTLPQNPDEKAWIVTIIDDGTDFGKEIIYKIKDIPDWKV